MHAGPLQIITLVAAAPAAVILIRYLVRKPILDFNAKLVLLLGLGVLPAVSAGASTVAGMEETTHRRFCGSCHVMDGHYDDSSNPKSQSLAARHSRNPFFGDKSCYVCHADYGMYGYVLTKAGGLRHVYLYYLGGYREMTHEEAEKDIHLMKPYSNTNCRQCHTGTAHNWMKRSDHRSLEAELAANTVSCVSAGCHGYAHPFSKQHGAGGPAAQNMEKHP